MRIPAALFVVLACAVPAFAQDVPFDKSKLYVSDPAACKALEEKQYGAFDELDFLTFHFADGIEGNEFHCEFFDVKSQPGLDWLFIDAICEEPGIRYPDSLSVVPLNDTELEVSSIQNTMFALSNPGTGLESTTIYTRCDNLTGMPH